MYPTRQKTPVARSPLRYRHIRRLPGQGLWESIFHERLVTIALWFGLAMGLFVSVIVDLAYRLSHSQVVGSHMVVLLITGLVMATWSVHQAFHRARSERLGLEGEVAVAQSLESLVAHGCRVFHDLQPSPMSTRGVDGDGRGPNIDHVVVSPVGLFVIETKTRSKRIRAGENPVVQFNGHEIRIDGRSPHRDPLAQVRAAAADLSRYLSQEAQVRPPLRPVVLFPGWYVKSTGAARESDVWVLNDTALCKWIERAVRVHPKLEERDFSRICDALAQRSNWRGAAM